MLSLSADEARRIAVAAQGLDAPPPARAGARELRRAVARLGCVQIDSVNVLARAHYLTLFSRVGAYPARTLDDLVYRRRELFEYWAHEASLIPVHMYPLFRWRMERMANPRSYGAFALWARENAGAVEAVYAQVRERGPLGVGDLAEPASDGDHGGGGATARARSSGSSTSGASPSPAGATSSGCTT